MIPATLILGAIAWVAAAGLASWLTPARWAPLALIAAGAGVLALLSWPSLLCLGLATLATYQIGRLGRRRTLATILAIGGIALLYLVLLWKSGQLSDNDTMRVLLPLGMAYYVLRLIHYLVEMERGTFRAHSLVDYAAYQFFPATLPVGPIHRFDDFLRDLRRRRWDAAMASWGASRMLAGAVKIILLGNFGLQQVVAPALAAAARPHPLAALYVETLTYWLNIYIQFSGYSSLAIGLSALLGFRAPENFNWPFLARNIGDFWRRWHITLSAWCRDYVYTPALAAWRTPFLAAAASMIVLGLWHEISLHYLLWGLYHATGLTVSRRFDLVYAKVSPRLSPEVRLGWAGCARLLTLHFVMFSYPTANALEALVLRR